ncbi:MAG: ABC transporter substrate-binding protein [Deltaproteobacteria bacterium RBG_19FT_COMBO_43_11]|nr:MAG: ABC transporter substrate-binding protein [Deltaproteobacteria bacterium RBG_19FT_COMBO_43_11]
MNDFKKNILVSVVIILLAVFSFTTAFGEEIKIGVIGPMKFVQGIGHWNGAVMAADEINARGGVKVGNKMMKIKLIQADSNEHLSVTDATNAMERLITRDKVDFVVGGFRTEAVLAMQDIAMERRVIFIGCGAAHEELCTRVAKYYDQYKYFFRMTPFNSGFLIRAAFAHVGSVAEVVKKELGIDKIKVAFVAEKAQWADPMVSAVQAVLPRMGMELVGVWRPSPNATDVTAELSAIQRSGAHIIFNIFSASVGIPFARQANELKIPAIQVGINVEAQKEDFWKATRGMGGYVVTSGTFARGVESNEFTKDFVEGYIKRFGEVPTYTTGTYDAIRFALVDTIEMTGSLNTDKIAETLENRVYKSTTSTIKYMKDSLGRPLHDIQWGPGFSTGIAVQWQDGKQVGVWPNGWKPAPGVNVTYKGMQPIKLPPWMISYYKKEVPKVVAPKATPKKK